VRARFPPVLLAICLGVALGAATPCLADRSGNIDYLKDCLNRLPAHTKRGLENLRHSCPELEQTLVNAGVSDQLPEHWREQLAPQGLRDIQALLERYQGEPPAVAPRTDTISEIAQGLRAKEPARSWWQRVRDWLRHLLEPQSSSDSGLLSRVVHGILNALTSRVRRVLFYASLALVVLLLGFIIWRELRIAGVGRRAGRRRTRGETPELPGATSGRLKLADLEQCARSERPALLLRLLVQALVRSGRLSSDRTLTHRELIARAGFDSPDQRQQFAGISLLAERQLYGRALPADVDADFERTLLEGRQLYAQLHSAGSVAS
jgi:hypothetical protein